MQFFWFKSIYFHIQIPELSTVLNTILHLVCALDQESSKETRDHLVVIKTENRSNMEIRSHNNNSTAVSIHAIKFICLAVLSMITLVVDKDLF